jgi:hypothetical protein
MNWLVSTIKKIENALQYSMKVSIQYVYRDPVEAFLYGMLPRAERMWRSVPITEHIATHNGSYKTIMQLLDIFWGHPNIDIEIIDNTGDKGMAHYVEPIELKSLRRIYLDLESTLRIALEKEYRDGKISERVYWWVQ